MPIWAAQVQMQVVRLRAVPQIGKLSLMSLMTMAICQNCSQFREMKDCVKCAKRSNSRVERGEIVSPCLRRDDEETRRGIDLESPCDCMSQSPERSHATHNAMARERDRGLAPASSPCRRGGAQARWCPDKSRQDCV